MACLLANKAELHLAAFNCRLIVANNMHEPNAETFDHQSAKKQHKLPNYAIDFNKRASGLCPV